MSSLPYLTHYPSPLANMNALRFSPFPSDAFLLSYHHMNSFSPHHTPLPFLHVADTAPPTLLSAPTTKSITLSRNLPNWLYLLLSFSLFDFSCLAIARLSLPCMSRITIPHLSVKKIPLLHWCLSCSPSFFVLASQNILFAQYLDEFFFYPHLLNCIFRLHPFNRRVILNLADAFLLPLSSLLSFWLRLP